MSFVDRPSLHRPEQGRRLAGVAAGLARRLEWRPWIVRLAFVLLCIPLGLGLFLYLAGWFFIPREGAALSAARRLIDTRRGRRWLGVLLIGAAVLMLAGLTGLVRGDLAFALILLAVGVLMYRGELGPSKNPPEGSAGEAPAPDAPAEAAGGADGPPRPPGPAAAAESASPPSSRKPKAAPRRRSYLGRVTLGFAVIAVGLLGLADALAPGFRADPRHYMALLVAVIGAGLVAGAWFGRSYGLILLGVLLTPALFLTPVLERIDLRTLNDVRDAYHRPAAVDEMQSAYRIGAGTLEIDLREVDFGGRTVEMEAEVGLGRLVIHLPDGPAADLTGRAGIGLFKVNRFAQGGIAVEARRFLEGAEGALLLDAEVSAGTIEVYR